MERHETLYRFHHQRSPLLYVYVIYYLERPANYVQHSNCRQSADRSRVRDRCLRCYQGGAKFVFSLSQCTQYLFLLQVSAKCFSYLTSTTSLQLHHTTSSLSTMIRISLPIRSTFSSVAHFPFPSPLRGGVAHYLRSRPVHVNVDLVTCGKHVLSVLICD